MSFQEAIISRIVGFVVAALGFAVIWFVLALSIPRYAELLNSQATIIMAFLLSLGLLIFSSGISIVRSGSLSHSASLTPRWVLGISGCMMLLSSIGLSLVQTGNSRSIVGFAVFGVLGIYWLRCAFRSVV